LLSFEFHPNRSNGAETDHTSCGDLFLKISLSCHVKGRDGDGLCRKIANYFIFFMRNFTGLWFCSEISLSKPQNGIVFILRVKPFSVVPSSLF